MKASKQSVTLVVGGALAIGVGVAPAAAAENPFMLKPLATGYMVADASGGDKTKNGKCGAGKCGGSMEKPSDKSKDSACDRQKDKQGACGGEKAKEGACSGEKDKQGACGGEKR